MVRLVFLAFTLLWTMLFGVFDAIVMWQYVKTLQARDYSTVEGIVIASEVGHVSGSKGGPTYSPRIEYEYMVNGTTFQGDRYDFATWSSSDPTFARQRVAEHPVGKAVTVYYDSEQPRAAVLSTEYSDEARMLPLFLTTFNIAGVMLWLISAEMWILRRGKGYIGAVRVRRDMGTECRFQPRLGPLAGLGAAAVVSFVCSIFVVAGSGGAVSEFHLAMCWGLTSVAGLVVAAIVQLGVWRGDYDLTVDVHGEVTLPKVPGLDPRRRTVPVGSVRSVQTALGASTEMESDSHRRFLLVSRVMLEWELDGKPRRASLSSWSSREDAEEFANWLRRELVAHGDLLTSDGPKK